MSIIYIVSGNSLETFYEDTLQYLFDKYHSNTPENNNIACGILDFIAICMQPGRDCGCEESSVNNSDLVKYDRTFATFRLVVV